MFNPFQHAPCDYTEYYLSNCPVFNSQNFLLNIYYFIMAYVPKTHTYNRVVITQSIFSKSIYIVIFETIRNYLVTYIFETPFGKFN